MNVKYLFDVDSNGKIARGTMLEWEGSVPTYPDYYTVEGTVDVWNAQDRAHWDASTENWTIAPFDTDAQLLAAKTAKIEDLNRQCNVTILAGFTSAALGTDHTYDFDYEAQTNLGGMLNAITAGIVTEPFNWKASGTPQPHTIVQFKQLYADGLTFKNTQITRYWTLKSEVSAATTKAAVDAIVW